MTRKDIEEAKEQEHVLLFLEREADRIKQSMCGRFELLHIEYDDRHDRLVYVGEGNDDGVGMGTTVLHSFDELVQNGWIEAEEDQ